MYFLSKFCHAVEGKQTMLYHTSNGNMAFPDSSPALEELLNKKHFPGNPDEIPGFKALVENGFLVKDWEKEIRDFKEHFQVEHKCKKINLMYLLLTSDCNLSCSYCMEKNKSRQHMNRETIDQALRLFEKLLHPEREISIILYGGEPLLNKDGYLHAVERIADMQKRLPDSKFSVQLVSNGTILDDDIIEATRKIGVDLSFSIDGPEDLHREIRESTGWEALIENYRRIRDAGLSCGISCTLSEKSLDRWEDILSYFHDELKVPGIGYNLMLCTEDREEYFRKVAHVIYRSFKFWRDRGIHEDRAMRVVQPLLIKRIYREDCAGYGSQIAVAPNGKVGPCQIALLDDIEVIGDVDRLIPVDIYEHPIYKRWNTKSKLQFGDGCIECNAFQTCGMGCTYELIDGGKDFGDKNENYCTYIKEITGLVLEEIANKGLPEGQTGKTWTEDGNHNNGSDNREDATNISL
jgi:uncharacterized protein